MLLLGCQASYIIINNNNRRLVTLAEHTSDHGKQTNSSTKEKGEHGKKISYINNNNNDRRLVTLY